MSNRWIYPFECMGCGSQACHGDCLPTHRDRYVCHTPWCVYHAPCPDGPPSSSESGGDNEDKKKQNAGTASSNTLTIARSYGINVSGSRDGQAPAAGWPPAQATTNGPQVALQFNFNMGQEPSGYTSLEVSRSERSVEPAPGPVIEPEPERGPQRQRAAQRAIAAAMPDSISPDEIAAQEGLLNQYSRRNDPEGPSTDASGGNNGSRGHRRRRGGNRNR